MIWSPDRAWWKLPEDRMYVIWSTKHQGWLSTAGNYTTDLKEAARFSRDAVLIKCAKQVTEDAFGYLPVVYHDLVTIQ